MRSKTKQKLIDALDRIICGRPVRTDAKLTPSNIAREAEVGRATLYRFPEILEQIAKAQDNLAATEPAHLIEVIKRLKSELGKLQLEENSQAREYKKVAVRCAQQVQVLALALRTRDEELVERDKLIAELRATIRHSGRRPTIFPDRNDVMDQKPTK